MKKVFNKIIRILFNERQGESMIIKTLVENTSISEEFVSEHGLCLYLETKKHKLLFDLGASDLFVENARKLGVDLSKVDLVVISHGHYDHGGGLKAFLEVNSKAKIYLQEKAFDKYYVSKAGGGKAYVGLEEGLLPNDRFVLVGDNLIIDDELELVANIKGTRLTSSRNQNLLKELGSTLVQDDFVHEQNLLIKENGKIILISGCAHNGIENIIGHFHDAKDGSLSHVVGGFHLYNRSSDTYEDPLVIGEIGQYLKNTGLQYYTGHCTGVEPYRKLKNIMGEQIQYIATGSQFIL